ncbi:MAG: Unknown protein [uncultured Sulfurovum sp.]|uniref:Uncharacterized protein n=1 Tax=uncultured Sulfurovum sp. TaxID=269237 RepID=A0A6S6TER8_9BACT|nr:MAG: Unknown protein [uncultured Sulfurovum sp.]
MATENKLKHLEFIQNVISRMANNSFLLKGWSLTLIAALFALNKDGLDAKIITIGIFIIFFFWILDAYFLRQERIFRKRYDTVSKLSDDDIDFSMKPDLPIKSDDDIVNVFFSITLNLFYIPLIIAISLMGYFL